MDGDSEFSSLLGKLCGSASNVTNILYSTQNKLYMRQVADKLTKHQKQYQQCHNATDNGFLFIRFYSNWDVSGHGFKLTYESVLSPCGNETNFVSPSGHLTSLRYPSNYIENSDCNYTISLKNGTFVKISFIDIQLEKTDQCRDSFLEIRDGNSGSSPLLGIYCGDISDLPQVSLQSAGPDIWIRQLESYYVSSPIHVQDKSSI